MATSGRMPLTLFRTIWSKVEFFRPILVAMVIHGDLDFFHVDMFNLLFGNLPAYTLSFMNRFLHQLKKEVAGDPKYGPDVPKCPIPMETPSWGERICSDNVSTMNSWRTLLRYLEISGTRSSITSRMLRSSKRYTPTS